MDKIKFQDATLLQEAVVNIDGVEYKVTPRIYSGGTVLNATLMHTFQENIERAINEKQSLPTGGTKGQVLGKTSDEDYEVGWINQTGSVPDIVVDNLDGNSTDKAPSQRAVNQSIKKAIASFGCSQNSPTYSASTGYGTVTIPLDEVLAELNNNEKFKLDTKDHSIKIGSGVSKIKVCGCVAINRGKTGYITCILYNNDTAISRSGIPFTDWSPASCQIEPIILEVKENDVLTFKLGSGADSSQSYTGYNANTTTYLTIEEL